MYIWDDHNCITFRFVISNTIDAKVYLPFQIASLTCVGIALPSIGRDFNEGPNNLQWLMSGYALTNVSQSFIRPIIPTSSESHIPRVAS